MNPLDTIKGTLIAGVVLALVLAAVIAEHAGFSVLTMMRWLHIAAGVARLPMDLPGDPHLVKSGHWQSVDRPLMGPHLVPSVAYREGDTALPYAIEHLAPTLGQHNEEVLRDLLGLTYQEIEKLRDDGIIGNVAAKQGKTKPGKANLAAE